MKRFPVGERPLFAQSSRSPDEPAECNLKKGSGLDRTIGMANPRNVVRGRGAGAPAGRRRCRMAVAGCMADRHRARRRVTDARGSMAATAQRRLPDGARWRRFCVPCEGWPEARKSGSSPSSTTGGVLRTDYQRQRNADHQDHERAIMSDSRPIVVISSTRTRRSTPTATPIPSRGTAAGSSR